MLCVVMGQLGETEKKIRHGRGSKGDLKPGQVYKVRGRGLITSSDRA